ncbi:NAD-dependent epimerase/dehydratase family protein [Microbacterium sp. Clip185]|uniref:NAD-dependent epimerase/dehydratase family protein n=1 Tax=Microbacterium sp. Clip185 TaxID=3025663 RepID=UPI0023664941|nr:NAD-dependent epimerase/dehydratase family protein [Microbacterium sp. Clip185]WDG18745.1 GDP-mannose 4,6-dehydratase [Microbacterium sp. Clip185]
MSTLVITGANGFVGSHLAAIAHADGHTVWAVGRETAPGPRLAPHADEYVSADLQTDWPVPEGADAIVHLAGLAAVGPSFADPQRYLTVNSTITTRMCETLLTHSHRPRVVVVSSGSVYATPAPDETVSETDPTTPNSPYAVAKLLVETQARYYGTRGLDTLIARPFNHIGPGQGPGFLIPDLTASLQALPSGAALPVGNLDAARDYTDVRDVARAYLTLALAPTHQHDLYNVATGTSHTGHEILHAIATALERPAPRLVVDESRLRPNDPPRITGDANRLRTEFGWTPTIDYTTSIADYIAQSRA